MPKRLSYANVMATVAVFIALGGASYAATNLPPDSVGTKELKPDSVGTKELKVDSVNHNRLRKHSVGADNLRRNAVDSGKVRDGSLEFQDFATGEVSPDLYAHVTSNGTLGVNNNADFAGQSGTGDYSVTFNRDIRGCVAVASVGFATGGASGTIRAGAIAHATILGNNQGQVDVDVFKGFTFSDMVDSDFNVIVNC